MQCTATRQSINQSTILIDLHRHGTAFQLRSIELINGSLGFFGGRELNGTVPTGATITAVHNISANNGTGALEDGL